ncbi:MAG: hypothetical protein ABIW82_15440 [Dokdonella sp.]
MNPIIADLNHKIRALEEELEVQLALASADLHLRIEGGKIEFEKAVLRRHREMKTRLSHYVLGAKPLIVLTAPLIYSLIVPLVLLDVFMTIYQAACFPVYDIPKVRRKDYFIFDRRYLAYLNLLEKFNCAFCSYGNGLLGYAREIASRTERYWCPIKHARKVLGAHPRYGEFSDFGDATAYRDGVAALNERVRADRDEKR